MTKFWKAWSRSPFPAARMICDSGTPSFLRELICLSRVEILAMGMRALGTGKASPILVAKPPQRMMADFGWVMPLGI